MLDRESTLFPCVSHLTILIFALVCVTVSGCEESPSTLPITANHKDSFAGTLLAGKVEKGFLRHLSDDEFLHMVGHPRQENNREPALWVVLEDRDASDENLMALRQIEGIRILDLHNPRNITKTGLAAVTKLPNLEVLEINFAETRDDDLFAVLKEAKSLRKLTIHGSLLDNNEDEVFKSQDAKHIARLSELRSLNLDGTAIDDEGLTALQDLKKLKELSLFETNVTGVGFAELGGLNRLESLNLGASAINDKGLAAIGHLKSLKLLSLNHTKITGVGFAELVSLENLQSIKAKFSALTDDGLQSLQKLKGLAELRISGTEITDEGLKALGQIKSLEILDLRECPNITDEGVRSLSDLPRLQKLFLDFTRVTGAGLSGFAKSDALTFLSLWGAPVSKEGLAVIATLHNLHEFHMVGEKLTEKEIVTLLESLKHLEKLDLGLDFDSRVTEDRVNVLQQEFPDVEIY